MSENYAMIDGVKYPIEFAGWDRETYKHGKGCLAYSPSGISLNSGPCQCDALSRTAKWYQVKVPPAQTGGSDNA